LDISTDGGTTFALKGLSAGVGTTDPMSNGVTVSGSTIYVATKSGLAVSTNGGTSFTTYTTTSGLVSDYSYSVAVSGTSVYVGTYYGGLGIGSPTSGGGGGSGGGSLVIPRQGPGVAGIIPRDVARLLGIAVPPRAQIAIQVDPSSLKRCANRSRAGFGYKVVSLKAGTCLVKFAILYKGGKIVRKTVRLPAA